MSIPFSSLHRLGSRERDHYASKTSSYDSMFLLNSSLQNTTRAWMNKNAPEIKPKDLVGICDINGIGEKRVAMAFHHRRKSGSLGMK